MLTKEPVASPSPSPSAVTTSARAATSGPTVGSCDFQRYDRSVRPLISATIAPTRSTPKGASGRQAGADPETRVVVLRRSGVGGSRVEAAGGRHTAQIVNPASTHTISDTQLSPANCSVLPASEPARATSASIACAASRATNTTIAAISAPRDLPRVTTRPSTNRPSANGSHGQPLGPGTQSSRPCTTTSRAPYRYTSVHCGMIVWNAPGAARTAAGGDVPIQCTRWSCQRTVCDPETRCHRGAVEAPVPFAISGMGVSPARVRLR